MAVDAAADHIADVQLAFGRVAVKAEIFPVGVIAVQRQRAIGGDHWLALLIVNHDVIQRRQRRLARMQQLAQIVELRRNAVVIDAVADVA